MSTLYASKLINFGMSTGMEKKIIFFLSTRSKGKQLEITQHKQMLTK